MGRACWLGMMDRMTCELCCREPAVATLRAKGHGRVCLQCVGRIAELLPRLEGMLGMVPGKPGLTGAFTPEKLKALDMAPIEPGQAGAFEAELLKALEGQDGQRVFDDVFEDFKRGVAAAVRPEDVETHLDLGVAYREMGLSSDAMEEFRLALQHARGDQIAKVLQEVFDTSTCELGQLRDALFPA